MKNNQHKIICTLENKFIYLLFIYLFFGGGNLSNYAQLKIWYAISKHIYSLRSSLSLQHWFNHNQQQQGSKTHSQSHSDASTNICRDNNLQ